MRILITGSRNWSDAGIIEQALFDILRDGYAPRSVTIVHGDCPTGADSLANQIAERHGFFVERHPADWKKFGKRAGFIRNNEMVKLGANAFAAFICPCQNPACAGKRLHESHGASMTVDLAERAEIPGKIYKVGF